VELKRYGTELAESSEWKRYEGSFNIDGEDGIYTIEYYSIDNVENREQVRTQQVFLDNTPPVTSIITGTPQYVTEEKLYIAPHTPIELTTIDPVVNKVASGVKEIYYSIDNQPFAIYNSSFTLGEGIHEVKYYSVDNLGNTEGIKTQIYYVDGTPPETTISIGVPQYESEGRVYISSETEITLSAIDPIVKDVSSGVKYTEYRIDGGKWQNYTGSFTLREGIRLVEYRSIDNVNNTEEVKSITLYVDETPPETSLSIEGIKYTKEDGIYVTSQTTFTLTADDPVVNEVSSGVKETKYRILSSTGVYQNWRLYEPINIIGPDGVYTIEYFSIDNVENQEEIKRITVKLDNTPPETQISAWEPRYISGDKIYISPHTPIELTSLDPVINEVAVGVEAIKYRIDGGEWKIYTGTFTLQEGIRTVEYYAYDYLKNTENIKSQVYYVDGTPPETEIHIGEPKIEAFGEIFISPETPITLSAVDPVVKEVASGVKYTEFRVDNEPYKVYTGTFTLDTGTHTVYFRSVDNVLNEEEEKSIYLNVTYLLQYAVVGGEGVVLNGKSEVYGDVRSNQNIELYGKSCISGDAITSGEVELKGKSEVEGEIKEGEEEIEPVPIDLEIIEERVKEENGNDKIPLTEKGKIAIDSERNLTLTGSDTLILSTGTYYLNDVKISGNSKLLIKGKVRIFVTGEIDITSKSLVNEEDIKDLVIFSNFASTKKGGAGIKISGNSSIKAMLYSPFSDFNLNGTSSYSGSIFVRSFKIDGSSVLRGLGYEEKEVSQPLGVVGLKKSGSVFELKEVYVYPNPAKGGKNPTFHIELSEVANKIELKIYTISADLIHKAELTGPPNKGTAYEYTWNTDKVASGVYLYLIRCYKEGYPTIKVIKKLAIIK